VSPFFANYGYHLHCKVTVAADTVNQAADDLVEKLHTIHPDLREQLEWAQEKYKANHDRHTKAAPQFTIGDKVWLLRKNIRTTHPSQKLDVKQMGPFNVLGIIEDSKLAYKLELPRRMRQIHPVFHVSLLKSYCENQ
jgi:hypothetical protein